MISLVDKFTPTLDTIFLLVQTKVLLNIFEFWPLLSWHKAFEIFELIVRFLHVCKNKNNFSDINIITQPFKLHLKGIGLLIWTEKIEQNAVAAPARELFLNVLSFLILAQLYTMDEAKLQCSDLKPIVLLSYFFKTFETRLQLSSVYQSKEAGCSEFQLADF